MPGDCYAHPGVRAVDRCGRCGVSVCDECWISPSGIVICRSCGKGRRRWQGAALAGALLLAGGAGAYALLREGPAVVETVSARAWSAEVALAAPVAPAGVGALALSPDGLTLASAGVDGQVALWDAQSGAPKGRLSVSKKPLRALAFAGGGWAAAGDDGKLYLLRADASAVDAALERHVKGLTGLASVPGSDLVVSVGADGQVNLWDAKQRSFVRALATRERGLLAVAVSPGGDRIAVGGKPGADGTAQLFLFQTFVSSGPAQDYEALRRDLLGRGLTPEYADSLIGDIKARAAAEAGAPIAEIKVEDPSITALAFSPDGTRLAIAGALRGVVERDLSSNGERPIAPQASARALAYLAEGKLAIASESGRLLLAERAALTEFLPGEAPASQPALVAPRAQEVQKEAALRALVVSAQRLYVAGDLPGLWVSELSVLAPKPFTETAHAGQASALSFLPDGQLLVAGTTGVYRYAVTSSAVQTRAHYPSGDTRALSVSRDGRYLGLVTECATSCRVDLSRGLKPEAARAISARLADAGVTSILDKTPEGVTLSVRGADAERAALALTGLDDLRAPAFQGQGVVSFSLDRGEGLRLEAPSEVSAVAFSPAELGLAAGLASGQIALFSAGDPRPLALLDGGKGAPLLLSYSPDGTLLAAAFPGGEVVLWDAKTRTRLRALYPFEGSPAEPLAMSFSPDGKRLVVANRASSVLQVEVESGERRVSFSFHEPVAALAYTADGASLAVGAASGAVTLFDAQGGQSLASFREPGVLSALRFGPDGMLYAAGLFPARAASLLAWRLSPDPIAP